MFSELGFLLLGLICCVVVIFLLHHLHSKALFSHLEQIRSDLSSETIPSFPDIAEIKEEMLDMVHETISNMQPPNAFDHLIGALAGPIQAWAMKKAGINPATGQPLHELIEESIEDFTQ
jgi:hypothetical protein